ncbi:MULTISPECIES: HNH endonuclease signature motif containing protein [Brevibacterium]|uniref:HNH endonuclease signature motif containing protein n=1 Tax=Brevibacterium TaxID=1696 RepID=UPI0020A684BA|nr:HNH endonuclease signature motif containing protein [Brevibacterium sp. CT2-23B]
MKNIGDSDGQEFGLPTAPPAGADRRALSQFRRAHGRRMEIAEENELVDLLSTYAQSSLAQVNSFIATSHVVAQDVAYALGLMGTRLDTVYEFASFTRTAARHRLPEDKGVDRKSDGDDCVVDVADDDAFSSTRSWTRRETRAWTQALAAVEAETGRKIDADKGRKKDRAAGRRTRRVKKLAKQLLTDPALLPDFPGYDPKLTFFTWLRGSIEPTEAGVYSSLLGATTSNSLRHMTSSMTLTQGLPKFLKRCLDGDFTIEHVDCVTRACRDLHFEHLPKFDDYLAHRRADITIETFKRSVALKIAVIQPAEDTLKSVSLRRRVDFSSGDDGTAYLTLTGPAPELRACFRRLDAFARAVHKSNTSAFSGQLKAGDCLDEERTISALMFDILTRTRPQLKLRIISTNDTDSSLTSTDFPLDGLFAGPDGTPMHEGESLLDYIERVFDDMDKTGCQSQAQPVPTDSETSAQDGSTTDAPTTPADRVFESQMLEAILSSNSATDRDKVDALSTFIGSRASGARPAAEGTGAETAGVIDAFGNPILDAGERRISFEFLLDMPTSEYWLANQASTFITVPLLTLLTQFQSEDGNVPPPTADPPGAPPPTNDPPGPPPLSTDPPDAPPPPIVSPDLPPMAEPPTAPTTPTDSNTPTTGPDGPLTSNEVCDLAGMLPNGSPIPADMARRVAGNSTTWTRLLTDPATGTPVDAKATSYAIPNSVRKTLVAQFVTCTFPGCTQPAEVSEVDHIDPFNHSDPTRGGLTRFGNLHCLCKAHHLQKTNGSFDVRMTEPGHLEYVFRKGVTVEVVSPDNPISVEHARLFLERFGRGLSRMGRAAAPEESSTEGPLTRESAPTAEYESGSDLESGAETSSAHSGDADTADPAPGDRKRAQECPEPAATDGSPGWRELTDEDLFAFTPTPVPNSSGTTSGTAHTDEDNAELRSWFWDNGEPPPF